MAAQNTVKIMVVDDNVGWAQGLEEFCQEAHVDYRPTAWVQHTQATTLQRIEPDVMLWDCTHSNGDTFELVQALNRQRPSLPMLVVVDFKEAQFLQALTEIAAIDLVRSSADMEEVVYRVRRLIRQSAGQRVSHPSTPAQVEGAQVPAFPQVASPDTSHPAFSHLALDMYDAQSGRLDARKIAALFGCKMGDLARLLGPKLGTLSKTADAPAVQPGLALFQRIGAALIRLVGSAEGVRIWMNAPNPQLEGRSPLAVVVAGEGEVVAEMLEDMLVGQPA